MKVFSREIFNMSTLRLVYEGTLDYGVDSTLTEIPQRSLEIHDREIENISNFRVRSLRYF